MHSKTNYEGSYLAGCGKTPSNAKGRPQLAKAALILRALRGAEAPLCHGTVWIHEFFRSLLEREGYSAADGAGGVYEVNRLTVLA